MDLNFLTMATHNPPTPFHSERTPEVSILIRACNVEKFLEEAVASVQVQDFKDWEMLILDDASDDATPMIAQRMASMDSRIRHIRQVSRQGRAKNANDGITRARGTFIAILDGDDLWSDPQRLTRQVSLLRQIPQIMLVAGGVVTVDERNERILMEYSHNELNSDQIRTRLLLDNPIPHSTAVYRRDAVIALDGYDERLSYTEDYDLWLRMGLSGKMWKLPGVMSRYRTHPGSITVRKRSLQIFEEMRLVFAYRRNYPHLIAALTSRLIPLLGSMLPHALQHILKNIIRYHTRKVSFIDNLTAAAQHALSNFTIRRISSFDELTPAQRASWDRCVSESEFGSVFQSLAWIETWWKHFGNNKTLYVLIATDAQGEIQAIFPGMMCSEKYFLREKKVLRFIGDPLNDVGEAPSRTGAQGAVMQIAHTLKELITVADIVRLQELCGDSPFFKALKNAFGSLPQISHRTTLRWRIRHNNVDAYRQHAQGIHRELKKKMKKLHKQGDISVVLQHPFSERHALLDVFFRMHIARSVQTSFHSPFHDSRLRAFYHDLIDACADADTVRMASISLKGEPLAVKYFFTFANTHSLFLTTFATQFQKLSLAIILADRLIESFFASSAHYFDFGRGDETYKRRFANEMIDNYEFIASRRSLLIAFWRIAAQCKHTLKRSDHILHIARLIKKTLQQVRYPLNARL